MNDATTNANRPVGRRVSLSAPAKVNLHLEVLSRRDDGYHDIETILQAVSLFDELDIVLLGDHEDGAPRIDLNVEPTGAAPDDGTNLVVRAAELICRRAGRTPHLGIDLRKTIPSPGGLGGGSSDAAATLVGCNRLLGCGFDEDALERMGAELGSDVPFFIRGGTQLARGRGTELTPLTPVRGASFVIVKPTVDLPTGGVYERLNLGLTTRAPKVNIRNTEALIARFPKGSWFGSNRLEDVVAPSYPELQRLLQELRREASVAMLSGSGAAVFAVYDDTRSSQGVASRLEDEGYVAWVAEPLSRGAMFKDE